MFPLICFQILSAHMQKKCVWEEKYEIMAHVDSCWSWVMGHGGLLYYFIFVFENFYNKKFNREGVLLGPNKASLNWGKKIIESLTGLHRRE